jgi:predicted amidophosphoribosyltransferase
MAEVHPTRIPGRWRDGYALDHHTVSSTYVGDDQYGRAQYDTKRSDLGELLYRLKYRGVVSVVPEIADAAASFLRTWNPRVELVVPVPASRARPAQPVLLLGEALAERLQIPFVPDCVSRVREVRQLKDVVDYDERSRLLAGTHAVDRGKVQGRRVLLVDDLYRSGATMNEITALLYDQGGAADVFALTITRTRSNR